MIACSITVGGGWIFLGDTFSSDISDTLTYFKRLSFLYVEFLVLVDIIIIFFLNIFLLF